jgi:threonine/homoserine/homoserine lactone efflux protein
MCGLLYYIIYVYIYYIEVRVAGKTKQLPLKKEIARSREKATLLFAQLTKGVFTSHANPKYFLFYSSHRIFGRMHGALNVGKKDN